METIADKIISIEKLTEEQKQLNEKILKLKRETWKIYNKEKSNHTLERFKFWLKYGPQVNINEYCFGIVSKRDKQLFEYDSAPMYPDRRQSFEVSRIAESLYEVLEGIKDGNKYYGKRFIEQDVYDWMEAIIELDAKSFIYDW